MQSSTVLLLSLSVLAASAFASDWRGADVRGRDGSRAIAAGKGERVAYQASTGEGRSSSMMIAEGEGSEAVAYASSGKKPSGKSGKKDSARAAAMTGDDEAFPATGSRAPREAPVAEYDPEVLIPLSRLRRCSASASASASGSGSAASAAAACYF